MGIRASVFTCAMYRPIREATRDPNGKVVHLCGNDVVLVDAAGPFDPDAGAVGVKLVVRGTGDQAIVHAVPVDIPGGCSVMSGGAFISSTDSRFREAVERKLGRAFYGAVPLHDRCERYCY